MDVIEFPYVKHEKMNLIRSTSISIFGVLALVGCTTTPTDPNLLSVVKPSSAGSAKIVTDPYHTSNDSFFVVDEGPCERSWLGYHVTKVIYTRFKTEPEGAFSVAVKPDRPTTIGFSYSIADKRCDVRGTFIPAAGKTYTMHGDWVFSDGLLPVSTGCKLKLIDDSTNEIISLMPSTIQERMCTPQQ